MPPLTEASSAVLPGVHRLQREALASGLSTAQARERLGVHGLNELARAEATSPWRIYDVVAGRIAARVSRESPGSQDVTCVLVSAIGRPVQDPQIVDIGLARQEGHTEAFATEKVQEIVRSALDEIGELRDELLSESLTLF